jgi:hypothetical protein
MIGAGPLGIGGLEILVGFVFLFGWVLVLIPAWVMSGKLGWPPAISLLVLVPFIGFLFLLGLAWEALAPAGQSRWLILLMLVPIVNVVMLWWLAFSTWPRSKELLPA